jgi:hypothetical protein
MQSAEMQKKKKGRSLVQLMICTLVKDSLPILFSLTAPRFILEKRQNI